MEAKIVEVIQVIHPALGKDKSLDWVTFYTKRGDVITSCPLIASFKSALEGKNETQDDN